MEHDESIVRVIVLLDHVGDLDLVLDREVGRIKKLIELDDAIPDPLVERGHRRDALILVEWRLLVIGELLVVEVRVNLQPIDEAFLRHVPSVRVHHGQRATSAYNKHARDVLVQQVGVRLLLLLLEVVEPQICAGVARHLLLDKVHDRFIGGPAILARSFCRVLPLNLA